MSLKTNKLNIFLIKEEFQTNEEIVSDEAQLLEIDGVGTFYVQESSVKRPSWLADFFGKGAVSTFKILTASAKALLLVPVQIDEETKRVFALTFGHGRSLLKEGVFEERFGLKVVLNSVDRTSLRSMDRTALGAVPKQSREQISKESEAASFGIDIEQDLLNAVTGKSNDDQFGKTISGRDSFTASVKVGLSEITAFLPLCFNRFVSEDYKKDFEWIDQVADVRDPTKRNDLNEWLIGRLKAEDLEKIWMAPPTIIDWVDTKGFRYGAKKKADLQLDLDVADFIKASAQAELSIEFLKKTKIYAISEKNDDDFDRWSAFSCLYAEALIENRVFILNNGKWYEIANGFAAEIAADFEGMPESDVALPNYNHGDEGKYNDSVPDALANCYSMDRKMVSYGGGHSTIEFCDIATADKRLIHVKHYSGSAQLSHLFNQGVVSGELYVSDQKFREKLNEKLPDAYKIDDITVRPNPSEYEVVFAIISKSNNPLDIPFFSKVGLRNARRRLQGFGYKVTRKKISNLSAVQN